MKRMIWNNTTAPEENIWDIRHNWEQYFDEEPTDSDVWELADEWNRMALDDELANLNIDVGYPIIVFANLGLWNGRHSAYKMLGSQNIRDCLNVCEGDYVEWFVDDNGELVIRDTHHDGTNVYRFRALRGGMSDTQIENFFDKLDNDEAFTWKRVKRYTRRLGDFPAGVYGWKLRGGVHNELQGRM